MLLQIQMGLLWSVLPQVEEMTKRQWPNPAFCKPSRTRHYGGKVWGTGTASAAGERGLVSAVWGERWRHVHHTSGARP